MIDIHCHLLPGVDDGPATLAESRELARELVGFGVTTVCVTPHITEWSAAGDAAAIRQQVSELQHDFEEQGIDLDLAYGAEVHIRPDLPHCLRDGLAPTLNGSRYLLLEFPYDHLPAYYEQVIFELRIAGIVPVIAHPERIGPLAADLRQLRALVERGCLAQVTAASLVGGFGRRIRSVAQSMVSSGLAQVIASDAHAPGATGRSQALAGVATIAAGLVGNDRAKELLDGVPGRLLSDAPVSGAEPAMPRKRALNFLREWMA